MMTFLKNILKTVAVLCFVGTLASVAVVWWLWNQSESLLTTEIRKAIAISAPELDIDFERASLDSAGWIQIQNFSWKDPTGTYEIVSLPDVRIAIDREVFAREQRIEVMRVRINNPKVTLIRKGASEWGIPKLPKFETKTPSRSAELEINGGTIVLKTEATAWNPPAEIVVSDFQASMVPSGVQRYTFSGGASAGLAGKIEVQGDVDLEKQSVSLHGDMKELHAGNELLNLVLAFMPELKTNVSKLDVRSAPLLQKDRDRFAPAVRYASAPKHDSNTVIPAALTVPVKKNKTKNNKTKGNAKEGFHQGIDLGTDLLAKLHFEFALNGEDRIPKFHIKTEIETGQIVHPRLPFPIFGVQGMIEVQGANLKIAHLKGTNGLTRIDINGEMSMGSEAGKVIDDNHVDQLHLKIEDLIIDDRLRAVLPAKQQKIYDDNGISGNSDLMITLYRRGENPMQIFVSKFELKNCIARHVKFPYPITQVNGTIHQKRDQSPPVMVLDFTGRAGKQPIKMIGEIRNPGPLFESIIEVTANKIPVDTMFRNSLDSKSRKIFEEMKLTGESDFKATFHRPAGWNQKTNIQITSHFRNAQMDWKLFPYPITKMSGIATYANHGWLFSKVQGQHAGTRLSASGSLTPKDSVEVLNIKLTAEDGQFDESLKRAITVSSPTTLEAWNQISPQGNFDVQLKMTQKPRQNLVVDVQSFVTKEASMTLKEFPYRLNKVNAILKTKPNGIEIESFSGWHGRTRLKFQGEMLDKQDHWVLTMDKLRVDDLIVDHDLNQALPKSLIQTVKSLKFTAPVSLNGRLELKGSHREKGSVTAAWQINTILSGANLFAGIDLKNVRGSVFTRGTVDSLGVVKIGGWLELASVEVLEYQVTQIKGPFYLSGNELLLGSEKTFQTVLPGKKRSPIPLKERIRGQIFGGTVSMDTMARLDSNPAFRTRLVLSRAKLEDWAKRSGYGQSNTRGVVTGWLDLQGQGKIEETVAGRGQLWITPAELYELPVFIRLFKALQFVPPDKTAFRYAYTDFRVLPDRFVFDRINLAGDALSLVGGGHMRFNKSVDMNLVSIIPRNQIPIPLLNSLVNNRLFQESTKGFVRVHIKGKSDNPEVAVRAGVPIIDTALQNMMKSFSGSIMPAAPAYGLPSTFRPPARVGNNPNSQRRPR